MSARMPRVVYSWMTMTPPKRSGKPSISSIIWTLFDRNGIALVTSFPQGFETKRAAQQHVEAVALTLSKPTHTSEGAAVYGWREAGPGRKPE